MASADNSQPVPGAPGPQPQEKKAPTVHQVVAAIMSDGIPLAYNELADATCALGPTPWNAAKGVRPWTPLDDAELYAHLQDTIGLRSDKALDHAMTIVAHGNAFNPLTQMLEGLKWDGGRRAGTLLRTYLGADDSPLTAAIECLFLCGAVKRAFRPGCKFDYTMVLAGRGGIGKSTFARRIALDDRYFCDSVYDLGNIKATGETLRGKWVVELAELTGISGRSLEAVKAGLVRQTDTFRVAYGKRSTDFQRRCVFVATTNTIGFIAEKSSGARRFLPVLCGAAEPAKSVHSAEFARDARQAMAEVVHWMKTGDPRFSTVLSAEMEEAAAKRREGFLEEDPRTDAINSYLIAHRDHPVCTHEIADYALRQEFTQKLAKDISAILTDQCPGWRFDGKRKCGPYGKQRCWVYNPRP